MDSPARENAFLSVRSVCKTFGVTGAGWLGFLRESERITALRDVSLDVARGQVFGLLGENGAGKTTLLHILATLVWPDSGSVVIDGCDVFRTPSKTKRLIGLCTTADRSFYYRLSLAENLQFFGALVGLSGRALSSRIREVLELVELTPIADRTYGRCSSGQRQRTNIARALIADPPLLLLDEPTRNLDPVHASALHQLVKDRLVRAYGKTVVLATNVLDEAWQLCDRVAVIREGRIGEFYRPSSLARPPIEELFGGVAIQHA